MRSITFCLYRTDRTILYETAVITNLVILCQHRAGAPSDNNLSTERLVSRKAHPIGYVESTYLNEPRRFLTTTAAAKFTHVGTGGQLFRQDFPLFSCTGWLRDTADTHEMHWASQQLLCAQSPSYATGQFQLHCCIFTSASSYVVGGACHQSHKKPLEPSDHAHCPSGGRHYRPRWRGLSK
jgi:hypothetical protein